jgi:DNA-binding transcriptional ArsR family regulator
MPPKTKPPHHGPREKFLRGPIPWKWLQRAACLPGQSLHVALILWQESGMRNRRTISFCQRRGMDLGMSIDTARRGLRRLEVAGLVTLKRMPGRGVEVTINETS